MSQSIPQVLNSAVTLCSTLISMIVLNVPLTIITLVVVAFMLFATVKLSGRSGAYFGRQQQNLGQVNGYIEEMMEGQKGKKYSVTRKRRFRTFGKSMTSCGKFHQANKFANILMPVNANLGHISYVLCAVLGAVIALNTHI